MPIQTFNRKRVSLLQRMLFHRALPIWLRGVGSDVLAAVAQLLGDDLAGVAVDFWIDFAAVAHGRIFAGQFLVAIVGAGDPGTAMGRAPFAHFTHFNSMM